jgi:hypothetical protein
MGLLINGQVGWRTAGVVGAPAGQDADALAFITAATITNPTQQSAIDTLVKALKSANIWNKMKALYPMVGGTAAQHRFNLKDPRTVNAAFYLAFFGGGTHSANGYQPNGNSYANTFLVPNTTLTQWNTHLSYYSRTTARTSTNIEMGSYDGTSTNLFSLILPRTNGLTSCTMYSQATSTDEARTTSGTTGSGFYLGTRTSISASTHKLFRNNSLMATASTSAGVLQSDTMYIGALHSGVNASFYSAKECAFASIGDGLTDTEAANLYTAVQAYQTTLGRAI